MLLVGGGGHALGSNGPYESSDPLSEQTSSGCHTFNEKQREAHHRVRVQLSDILPLPDRNRYNDDDIIYRFLIAKQWKEKDAIIGIREYHKWRVQTDVDSLSKHMYPLSVMEQNHGYFRRDREGCPVYYDQPNPDELSQLVTSQPREVLLNWHTVVAEMGRAKCKEAGVDRITAVVDMRHMGMGFVTNKKAFGIFKECSHIDQHYFPENMRVMCIIHAPKSFRFIWGAVKATLEERVQKKINFISKMEDLDKFVRMDDVPIEFGGMASGWQTVKDELLQRRAVENEVGRHHRAGSTVSQGGSYHQQHRSGRQRGGSTMSESHYHHQQHTGSTGGGSPNSHQPPSASHHHHQRKVSFRGNDDVPPISPAAAALSGAPPPFSSSGGHQHPHHHHHHSRTVSYERNSNNAGSNSGGSSHQQHYHHPSTTTTATAQQHIHGHHQHQDPHHPHRRRGELVHDRPLVINGGKVASEPPLPPPPPIYCFVKGASYDESDEVFTSASGEDKAEREGRSRWAAVECGGVRGNAKPWKLSAELFPRPLPMTCCALQPDGRWVDVFISMDPDCEVLSVCRVGTATTSASFCLPKNLVRCYSCSAAEKSSVDGGTTGRGSSSSPSAAASCACLPLPSSTLEAFPQYRRHTICLVFNLKAELLNLSLEKKKKNRKKSDQRNKENTATRQQHTYDFYYCVLRFDEIAERDEWMQWIWMCFAWSMPPSSSSPSPMSSPQKATSPKQSSSNAKLPLASVISLK